MRSPPLILIILLALSAVGWAASSLLAPDKARCEPHCRLLPAEK